MNRKLLRRGVTLVEMTIGLAVLGIIILASGAVLMMLTRGQNESANDVEAQSRIDLVREIMVSDFRAGTLIEFPVAITTPTPADAPGTINLDGSGGLDYQVTITTNDYDVATNATIIRRYRWAWTTGDTTIRRYRQTFSAGSWSAETLTFSQNAISGFTVIRKTDGDTSATNDARLDFTLSCTQSNQSASIAYSVFLRNVN